MKSGAEPALPQAPPRAGAAIDNLRAIVILLVLAFHSVLAYISFLPHHPFPFDQPPFEWRAFPIVDDQRWMGFDLFCAWLDVFLMSFFFMLSGLFAWPSLSRKGAGVFLSNRVLRIGVPFVAVVFALMPPTLYPTYLQSATEPGVAAYWRHWQALPLWPSGPMWFLWLLLAGDGLAAALYQLLAARRPVMLRLSSYARRCPAHFLAGVALASALGYIPLALAFGPSAWAQFGPFPFQLSRPLHYAVYFFAGVTIGACGIERGLVAPDGPLARRWLGWTIAAPLLFFAWCGLTGLTMDYAGAAPLGLRLAAYLVFVLACFSGCFMAFAVALRFIATPRRALDGLKSNAYGMYLVHYLFVVWLQFALLGMSLPAIAKGTIVFATTLLASWMLVAGLRRLPAVAPFIGEAHRVRPAALPSRPPGRSEGLARR